MKLFRILLVFIICMLSLTIVVHGQGGTSRKQKKIAQQKEKKDAEALEKYQDAIKNHNKNQSKDTRKRMRQSRKKARENNPYHKDFFLKKWFSNLKKK